MRSTSANKARGHEMDMRNLAIATLTLGGNLTFFWGFFKLLSLTVFKRQVREAKEPDIDQEFEEVSKEIERM
jgi:hypothetical protein